MKKFIRVDHAGERGAIKIYEGQLLALNTLVKDENLKKTIEKMKNHEKEHLDFFNKEIKKRNIKPTKLLPLWDLLRCWTWIWFCNNGKKSYNVMHCFC